ncbi:MAG: hypothetical protein H6711_05415 [Myxococcales bacterium]|nr:hypothetical protein [Myxococcales bacterium]
MDRQGLARALAALVRRLHPTPAAIDEAAIDAAIAEAIPRLLEGDPVDEEGSLSRADLYRIRAAKLIARLLPVGALAEPERRRRLQAELRREIGALLGGPLPPSLYLDRRRPPE